jgi:hypothetical protein
MVEFFSGAKKSGMEYLNCISPSLKYFQAFSLMVHLQIPSKIAIL